MKKQISNVIIIFCLCLILFINVTEALTLNTMMDYSINNNEIIVNVNISDLQIDENAVNAISAKIEYDKEKLNLQTIFSLNDWINTYSEQNNKITAIKLNGTKKGEDIFQMKFEILNKETFSSSIVILKEIVVSDGNKEINLPNTNVNLVINTNTNNTVNNNINKNNVVNKVNNNINKNNAVNNKIVISQVSNTRNNIVNNTVLINGIPYAGFRNYIRIAILIVSLVAIIIYIKYKKIDKIC